MKISDIKKEELELMSYNDITEILLSEKNNQTTAELFKQIVELLSLPSSTFENKVGDFYTSLSNDKRYILLEDGKWDLRKNHKTGNIIIEEDIEDVEPEEVEEVEIDELDELYPEDSDDDIVSITEEYKDLVIVDEEDLESE